MIKKVLSLIPMAVLFWGILFIANGGAHRASAPGLPDLTVTLGRGSVSGVFEIGQSIGVKPTLTNAGSAAVSNYRIVVYFSDHSLMSVQDISPLGIPGSRIIDELEVSAPLGPGASTQPKIKNFEIPDDYNWGDYYVTVIVDPGKKIPESDENNNRAELPIFVRADIDFIDLTAQDAFCCHGKGFGAYKSGLTIRIGPFSFPADPNKWTPTSVHYKPQCGIIPFAPSYDKGLYYGSKAIARTIKGPWGIALDKCVPNVGPAGTSFTIQIVYCAGASQGTKKLELWNYSNQFVGEVAVTSWSDTQISGVIPNIPPGTYMFVVTEGGTRLSFLPTCHFTVI